MAVEGEDGSLPRQRNQQRLEYTMEEVFEFFDTNIQFEKNPLFFKCTFVRMMVKETSYT